MTIGFLGLGCQAKAPKGKLTYCRYYCFETASVSKNYCELIAEPGADPKVSVVLGEGNRFQKPEIRAEYPVSAEDVQALQDWLAANKVFRLNGYDVNEPISGGSSYRIDMRYDSGETIMARWYGNKIKPKAIDAYNYLYFFFAPWRDQAIRESKPAAE
ncbi:MAG: hypothetical protein K6G86_00205 [Bacteroidales bacterium]|nr:hypothetical protein [Bacteroidales bacterium]